MNYEVYSDIEVNDDFDRFTFASTGKNGVILKRVTFIKTGWNNVYNLVLTDVDSKGEMSYYSVSDNGDRDKVLATVIKIAGDYTQIYPDRWIYFTGSTLARIRLYRILIGLHFEELSTIFEIYSYVDDKLVLFVKDLKTNVFLFKRKII